MALKQQKRLYTTLQNSLFYGLVCIIIFLLAQLSLKTDISTDWTANSRHTLSATTVKFLQQLETKINIQVFISPNNQYQQALEDLLGLYQHHNDLVSISYIDPQFSPDLVRHYNIQQQAEMVISQGQKQRHVYDLSEQSLSNALISVSRLKQKNLVFIEGHGERSPFKHYNSHLSLWGEELTAKGFKLQALNLVDQPYIADNTAVVIIASPQQAWLAGEINIINDYIQAGGNILLLADPDTHQNIAAISQPLAVQFIAGTVIDPNAKSLGINDPRFSLINDYADQPIGHAISMASLFPQAVALSVINSDNQWQITSLLNSPDNVWSTKAKDKAGKQLVFDPQSDHKGPFSLAYLITRTLAEQQQRISIIGDSDFLSNSYLGNAANLELAMATINWLSHDDQLILIPPKTTADPRLELSSKQALSIGLGFLIVLPASLFFIGFIVWRKRRNR